MNIISSALHISSVRYVNHPGWSLGVEAVGEGVSTGPAAPNPDAQGSPFAPLNYVSIGPKISFQRSLLCEFILNQNVSDQEKERRPGKEDGSGLMGPD